MWVQIFATAAGQNVNTMSALSSLFSQAAIDRYAIKLGQEVCYASQTGTDGRQCRLEAKASSFRAAEGGLGIALVSTAAAPGIAAHTSAGFPTAHLLLAAALLTAALAPTLIPPGRAQHPVGMHAH
ncbi:hypothetical protein ACFV4P_11930 [Kitasatospora sp. NPDC059795]|uniref:hypothetical protein n=1 Tax=Kitasatospora sp. NPDC059795 TaxID=3346949 RepID=UPI0036658D1A